MLLKCSCQSRIDFCIFSTDFTVLLLETDVKCSQGFREPGLVKSCVDTLLALKKKRVINIALCLKKSHGFNSSLEQ